ncbi:MAG: ABC transporter permease [Elusimicrobia bacterium]|nr:ABC transporter permease [Elusimicrobiota bacterium]
MNVGESVRTGFVEIWSHKTRSFLSFSSIAFGVAAILYTFANVNGMYIRRTKAFDIAGPGRLEIEKRESGGFSALVGLSKGLTTGDAEAMRAAMPWLYMLSPTLRASADLRDGDFRDRVQLEGVTLDWAKRGWVFTKRGRFFNSHDLANAARVCIVLEQGGWAGKKPFWARFWRDDNFAGHARRADMLGRTIQLDDGLYTVIGVLKNPPRDKDPRWFFRSGGLLILPLTTVQRYLARRGATDSLDGVDNIIVDTGSVETIPRARRRIEALLSGRHRGVADYEIKDFREMVQNMLENMRKYAVAVLAVGVVAVLAGGVGIMNVTLATIFSRIREIGVRRALGGTRADILVQFLTEAALLGVLGGIAGIGLGLSGIRYLSDDGAETVAALLWWHFPATLAISAGTALLFALYPAYQASRLDPVEALRYE